MLGLTTTKGKRAKPWTATVLGELAPEDLLATGGPRSAPEPLERLRSTHHLLAQRLASGLKQEEVSAITGYSASRISILQRDPAFQGLLAFYKERQQEIFVDLAERVRGVSLDALEVIGERLREEPEEFTNRDLLELVSTSLDRVGLPATTKIQSQVTVLGARELAELKEAAKDAGVRTITTRAAAPDSAGAPLSLPSSSGAAASSAEAAGGTSEGDDV